MYSKIINVLNCYFKALVFCSEADMQLLEIENVRIMTQVGIYSEIEPEPLGFSSGLGYISPYITQKFEYYSICV